MRRTLAVRLGLLAIAIAGCVALILVVTNNSYQFRFMFVPPFSDRFTVDGYTLFAVRHLIDVANLLFMLLPGLLMFVVIMFSQRRAITKIIGYRFLALAIAGSLVITFVFDPRLGMPRDWDLFAFVGIPLSLLLYGLLTDRRLDMPGRQNLYVLSITLGILVLGPRVAVLRSSENSLKLVRYMTSLDHTKSKNLQYLVMDYFRDYRKDSYHTDSVQSELRLGYPEIALQISAAQDLQEGKYQEAVSLASQVVAVNPMFSDPYGTMSTAYIWLRQPTRALEYAEIEIGLNSRSACAYYDAAAVYISTGDLKQSNRFLEKSIEVDSQYSPALGALVSVSLFAGDAESARLWLHRLDRGSHLEPSHFTNIAGQCLQQSNFALAAEALSLGSRHGVDSTHIARFIGQYPSLIQYLKW